MLFRSVSQSRYGQGTIVYSICDNGIPSLCDTATVVITILPINEPPVAMDIYSSTQVNNPVGINISSATFDPNSDPMNYSYLGSPLNGTWSVTGSGAGVYTPNTGFVGVDSFRYVVCDNSPYPINSLCDTAWVIITVVDTSSLTDTLNHAPIASNDGVSGDPILPVVINQLANDFDPDGDSLVS